MLLLCTSSVRGCARLRPPGPYFWNCLYSTNTNVESPQARNKQKPVAEKPTDSKELKAAPLPPLDRPLGVVTYPTTILKTRTEKITALMDQDVRMAQRRHLIKEASKGYFNDLNATRRNGGKTWIAPNVMIREDKALYLPNISGNSLDKGVKKDTTILCAGRVTVLAMLSTKISEYHAQGFVDPTHQRYSSHPSYQYVQINLQENLLKSFMVNLFANTLRRTVPLELQPTYLISSQNMEYVREPMGMVNSKVGYVYLVDENLKIRWGACADATLEETQALLACTGVLLNRLDRKLPKGTDTQALPDSGSVP